MLATEEFRKETEVSESRPPENKSGSGIYIVGVVLLAAGIGGIVYFTRETPKKETAPTQEAPRQVQQPPPAPPPPPPPKPTATESAAPSAEPSASASPSGKAVAGGGSGACSKCGEGVSNSALNSAIQGAAGSARGCYNRALQKNAGAAGKMNVAVQVGATGAVCGASITSDSVGSGEVSNCVLSRFQGKSFPKPDKGCVTINVPLSFSVKE